MSKKFKYLCFIFFSVFFLAACQSNNLDPELIGTWGEEIGNDGYGDFVTFLENGQGFRSACSEFEMDNEGNVKEDSCVAINNYYFRWEIIDDAIHMTHYFLSMPGGEVWEYDIIDHHIRTNFFPPIPRLDFTLEPTFDLDDLDLD